jgi:hypothetical protein
MVNPYQLDFQSDVASNPNKEYVSKKPPERRACEDEAINAMLGVKDKCNLHKNSGKAEATTNQDLRTNEEKRSIKHSSIIPLASVYCDRYAIGLMNEYIVDCDHRVILRHKPQEEDAPTGFEQLHTAPDENPNWIKLILAQDVSKRLPEKDIPAMIQSRPWVDCSKESCDKMHNPQYDEDIDTYSTFVTSGKLHTTNLQTKKVEEIEVQAGDCLCIKIWEDDANGCVQQPFQGKGGVNPNVECVRYYLVPKFILKKIVENELPDYWKFTFVIGRKQQHPTEPDIFNNPWTQSRSSTLYDCLISGERPSGPMPNHRQFIDEWYNLGYGQKMEEGMWMDKIEYQLWQKTCREGKWLEKDWTNIRHCAVKSVDFNGRRESANIRMDENEILWKHYVLRTGEVDNDRMSGQQIYREKWKKELSGKKIPVLILNELYHHFNFGFLLNPREFTGWTHAKANEASAPEWVKINTSQDRRICYKKVSPFMYGKRNTRFQPAATLSKTALKPMLFPKKPNDSCEVEDVIHDVFLSDDKIISKEDMENSDLECLKYLGKLSSFWKKKKNKKRRRNNSQSNYHMKSCKEIIQKNLTDGNIPTPSDMELLPTNGDAGYAKIFDNDEGKMFPLFAWFLDRYFSACQVGYNDADRKEFVGQLQNLISDIEEKTKLARHHEGKPEKEVKCHKLYAIVYYNRKGDQSFHIDIGIDEYQALRSCQSGTKPTTVGQVNDRFVARNFPELVKVNQYQSRFVTDQGELFPNLESSMESLHAEFLKEDMRELSKNSQCLQLPFCYTPMYPINYCKAKEYHHLRNIQREGKKTSNRKTKIVERANGVVLDPIPTQSKSLRVVMKEVKNEIYLTEDYLMEKGDTIIMSGGIPHYGPSEEMKVKLFFDLTCVEDDGSNNKQAYNHQEQVDMLVLYVGICEQTWGRFKQDAKRSGRGPLIRWLISSYIIRMCTHSTVYTKFRQYGYLFLEFKTIEEFALRHLRRQRNELPRQAIDLFEKQEDGRYQAREVMIDLFQRLIEVTEQRNWIDFDSLFSQDVVILNGPVMHVDYQNQQIFVNDNTTRYLARDISPLQLVIEQKTEPRTTTPLHQFTVTYEKDGDEIIANTEMYRINKPGDDRYEESTLEFPGASNRQHKEYIRDHCSAMYTIHGALNRSPMGNWHELEESSLPLNLVTVSARQNREQDRDDDDSSNSSAPSVDGNGDRSGNLQPQVLEDKF